MLLLLLISLENVVFAKLNIEKGLSLFCLKDLWHHNQRMMFLGKFRFRDKIVLFFQSNKATNLIVYKIKIYANQKQLIRL